MAIMTVYHGGYQAVEKPEIRKGRNTKDFGTGFYCTIIKEQAQRWARRYDTKVVSVYDVRLKPDLKIKEFKDMTEEWLDFIIACRSGKDHEYDIVIGAMADESDFIILFRITWMVQLPENSSGSLQSSSIQPIRSHFAPKNH